MGSLCSKSRACPLTLKVDDLSMATVHTNVGPDQCLVGDISLNRKRSPSSGSRKCPHVRQMALLVNGD